MTAVTPKLPTRSELIAEIRTDRRWMAWVPWAIWRWFA